MSNFMNPFFRHPSEGRDSARLSSQSRVRLSIPVVAGETKQT